MSELGFAGTHRFEVRARLGAGGAGVVYAAHDREAARMVAIKVLHHSAPQALYRFKREFRALRAIEHPNLVRLGELYSHDGDWFFTMELVEGEHLLSWIRPGGKLDERRLRDCLRQLATGLADLHAHGIVHRDIKPSNIMVSSSGALVILDFGLIAEIAASTTITELGAVGTLIYTAPEQAARNVATPAADWYSVGAVLFHALTGKPPFKGSRAHVIEAKHAATPPRPAALVADIPPDLDALCVGLLDPDPAARPVAASILARVGAAVPADARAVPPRAAFVGRKGELARLRAAFARTEQRQASAVLLRGASGIGKTALVTRFLDEIETPELVVLRGKCNEFESVPYKALDGVIDSLSHYLRGVDAPLAASFVPQRASILLQLFPVLARVPCIASADRRAEDTISAHERAARAVGALRELFSRIAESHTVVITIDDLQWADADSLRLLADLLAPPDAPPLFTVLTFRTDNDRDATVLLPPSVALETITVPPLDGDAGRQLAEFLVRERADLAEIDPAQIANEARGHPLYISELVEHMATAGPETRSGRPRLDDAIVERIARLPREASVLLEAVAVSGMPLSREVAAHASTLDAPGLTHAVAKLRDAQLAHVNAYDEIDTHHDRVREALLDRLSPDQRRTWHRRLADALRRCSDWRSRPDRLLVHLQASDQNAAAAELAEEAAIQSQQSFAFDRAAELWAHAIALGQADPERLRALHRSRAEALVGAGRAPEAAAAFLAAAEGADQSARLACVRRAAEQLLISGHIDEGLRALGEVGEDLRSSPLLVLTSIAWNRAAVALRGLRWKERSDSEVEPETLARLEVFRAVALGLASVDTARSVAYQMRGLRLAMRSGASERVGNFLALDAILCAAEGRFAAAESRLTRVSLLAQRLGSPYLSAWERGATACHSYFRGAYTAAIEQYVQAEALFRDRIADATWELDNIRTFRYLSALASGRLSAARGLFDEYLRDAERRGDHYMATSLRLTGTLLLLRAGDVGAAHHVLASSSWTPPRGEFHVQTWYDMEARVEIALYEGNARSALIENAPTFDALDSSLLTRVQVVRCRARSLRAQLHVAAALSDQQRRARHLRHAAALARRIEREPVPYAAPLARLVTAAIAAQQGHRDRAIAGLRAVIDDADRHQLRAHAMIAMYRLSEMLAGEESHRLRHQASAWAEAEGIAELTRFAAVLAPGFPTTVPTDLP